MYSSHVVAASTSGTSCRWLPYTWRGLLLGDVGSVQEFFHLLWGLLFSFYLCLFSFCSSFQLSFTIWLQCLGGWVQNRWFETFCSQVTPPLITWEFQTHYIILSRGSCCSIIKQRPAEKFSTLCANKKCLSILTYSDPATGPLQSERDPTLATWSARTCILDVVQEATGVLIWKRISKKAFAKKCLTSKKFRGYWFETPARSAHSRDVPQNNHWCANLGEPICNAWVAATLLCTLGIAWWERFQQFCTKVSKVHFFNGMEVCSCFDVTCVMGHQCK